MSLGIQNDLTGRRFGRLLVLDYCGKADNYIALWRCVCDCGKEVRCRVGNLTSGNSTSCGCGHGVNISNPIEHQQLLALVFYKRRTGEFIARRDWHGVEAGKNIGCIDIQSGYQHITLGGIIYYGHVLSWFYVTKSWPAKQVDHKNTIRSDNRWNNLRLATGTQQNANHSVRKDSRSGYKGVRQVKGKWQSYIIENHKQRILGYTESPETAASFYDAAARKVYGVFARTNFYE